MQEQFITTYQQLKQWHKPTLRSRLRSLALTCLSSLQRFSGAEKEYLARPRVQFLYLHHLFEDEEKQLDTLLRRLAEKHVFISYTEAVNKILTGSIDKPYISFSSDDGLKNNLAVAEILNRYNAKACFFINPPLIGEKDYNKLKEHCNGILDFPVAEFLTWDEVYQLQKWGHEIGGHTMHHMNIAQTPADAILKDMYETRAALNEQCGESAHFAFPYGRFFHFSETGRKAVFEAGYQTCASAERGCHINPAKPVTAAELCIRRDHIVLGWDMSHIMYFIIKSAQQATAANNYYPSLAV